MEQKDQRGDWQIRASQVHEEEEPLGINVMCSGRMGKEEE